MSNQPHSGTQCAKPWLNIISVSIEISCGLSLVVEAESRSVQATLKHTGTHGIECLYPRHHRWRQRACFYDSQMASGHSELSSLPHSTVDTLTNLSQAPQASGLLLLPPLLCPPPLCLRLAGSQLNFSPADSAVLPTSPPSFPLPLFIFSVEKED